VASLRLSEKGVYLQEWVGLCGKGPHCTPEPLWTWGMTLDDRAGLPQALCWVLFFQYGVGLQSCVSGATHLFILCDSLSTYCVLLTALVAWSLSLVSSPLCSLTPGGRGLMNFY
jgi:hypothetical protein